MPGIAINLYSSWRSFKAAEDALREAGPTSPPSERLLQLVWHYQRLLRDQLKTLDGQPVQILHPGFWNREAGPDFQGAIIRFGSEMPRTGDIEIDLAPQGWRQHRHEDNPAYKNVILHVVWQADPARKYPLPVLPLAGSLDASLEELQSWFEGGVPSPESLLGQCCAPLRNLAEPALAELLRQAASVRLQRKAALIEARARQAGWEQALWEGLFMALGYKHNVWPMRCLAELRPIFHSTQNNPFELQARLLGLSGLLPSDLNRSERSVDSYVRRIWDIWWRERDRFSEIALPRSLWRLSGIRPANHPQRRLALAAHWMADREFIPRLEFWLAQDESGLVQVSSLLKLLQISGDDFWPHHWTLASRRTASPQPLLGEQRATDLATNVILPWFWIRAVLGKNKKLTDLAEKRYFTWPKGEDNSLLRQARQRLFGGASPRSIRTASDQQGLLQIIRDFCDHSNALCENCRFPDLVKQFRL